MGASPRAKICGSCLCELRPLKNGVHMVEMATFGPVAIWQSDLWYCPTCPGVPPVSVLADAPWAQDHVDGFAEALAHIDKAVPFWLNRGENDSTERVAIPACCWEADRSSLKELFPPWTPRETTDES